MNDLVGISAYDDAFLKSENPMIPSFGASLGSRSCSRPCLPDVGGLVRNMATTVVCTRIRGVVGLKNLRLRKTMVMARRCQEP